MRRSRAIVRQKQAVPGFLECPMIVLSRALAGVAFAVIGMTCQGVCHADEPFYYAPGGIALSGYDAVSYFKAGGPVRGSQKNALMWRGATWYFASPETLMQFEMDPEAFAPQFGGYCAYSVAEGHTGTAEPGAFVIYEGKLYLLHDSTVLARLQPGLASIIQKAEANWPDALDK